MSNKLYLFFNSFNPFHFELFGGTTNISMNFLCLLFSIVINNLLIAFIYALLVDCIFPNSSITNKNFVFDSLNKLIFSIIVSIKGTAYWSKIKEFMNHLPLIK